MTRCRRRERGATLIEILIALVLVALIAGGMFLGLGMVRRARLREATTFLTSAIHVAYLHANSTSRPTRLALDFSKRTITLEETEGRFYVAHDRAGGAAGANDLEKEALAAGEDIIEGVHAPRPEFHAVQHSALDAVARARETDQQAGNTASGKDLPSGIYFRQVEVAHEEDAVTSDQVYLYFWPGGQTERAAIQLQLGEQAPHGDVMTVSVAPLTGQVTIDNGPVEMRRPRTDAEASE